MRRLLYILLAIATLLCAGEATARRAKVSNKPVKVKTVQQHDTLRITTDENGNVRFSGYDKPAASDREVFFATNNHPADTLRRFEAEIEYSTLDHRQLHRRNITVNCDIPPGQTRLIDIKSWDAQNSFRYFRSREGRNAATPYDVHIQLLRCWFTNPD